MSSDDIISPNLPFNDDVERLKHTVKAQSALIRELEGNIQALQKKVAALHLEITMMQGTQQ